MLQFDLPIMYRAEHYWNSGRMPSLQTTKPITHFMRRLQFCIEGVSKLFKVPNDAHMIQFVISSREVPHSYLCRFANDGTIYVDDMSYYDWVTKEFATAILSHSGNITTWYLQCFYWVYE